eukprot:1363305-Rhodomonas_salina.1
MPSTPPSSPTCPGLTTLTETHASAPQTAPALKEGPEGSGVETPVTPVKPIDKFSKRWEAILDRVCAPAADLAC